MANKNIPFQTVLNQRLSRRNFLVASSTLVAAGAMSGCHFTQPQSADAAAPHLSFTELPQGLDKTLSVSPGYTPQVLIRWGDALFDGVDDFDPQNQTAERQAKQFGFNNDFIGFLPLPLGSQNSDHGLLTVNHEYTNATMMFPGSPKPAALDKATATPRVCSTI